MKSFNKLIGVFVVSATVLLTGCNIEALGNFGKATATFKEFAPITKSAYEMCLLGKELEYHKAIVQNKGLNQIFENDEFGRKVGCKPFLTMGVELEKALNNIAIYGALLASLEKDANINKDDLKSMLGTIESFSIGEDLNVLKGLNLENKEEINNSVNKLGGFLKLVINNIYKLAKKKNLVSIISMELMRSEKGIRDSMLLLQKYHDGFGKNEPRCLDSTNDNDNDGVPCSYLMDLKKDLLEDHKEELQDIIGGSSSYKPSIETLAAYRLALANSDEKYDIVLANFGEFQKAISQFKAAHALIMERAKNSQLESKRFDGEFLFVEMEEYLYMMKGFIENILKRD